MSEGSNPSQQVINTSILIGLINENRIANEKYFQEVAKGIHARIDAVGDINSKENKQIIDHLARLNGKVAEHEKHFIQAKLDKGKISFAYRTLGYFKRRPLGSIVMIFLSLWGLNKLFDLIPVDWIFKLIKMII